MNLTKLLATGAALITFATASQAADDWTANLQHFSADQGNILLQLSRDLYSHKELKDAEYIRCIAPADEAAADAKAMEEWTESFKKIQAAAQQLGADSYAGITDLEARARTGKQLAESGWLRQYKNRLRSCLYTPEVKGVLKMH